MKFEPQNHNSEQGYNDFDSLCIEFFVLGPEYLEVGQLGRDCWRTKGSVLWSQKQMGDLLQW